MSETTQEFQLPTAGPEHEMLKAFEGTFKSDVKMWMDPTQEPHQSTGTMVNSWHLNGLYLNQDYQGDAVEGPFPNFAGKGYFGYNQTKGCFEGFWIDTATTMMQTESGAVDESGKVWEMFSEVTCPQSHQTMEKRTVLTVIDNDHHKMEMYFKSPEGEMKGMEINYTRAS